GGAARSRCAAARRAASRRGSPQYRGSPPAPLFASRRKTLSADSRAFPRAGRPTAGSRTCGAWLRCQETSQAGLIEIKVRALGGRSQAGWPLLSRGLFQGIPDRGFVGCHEVVGLVGGRRPLALEPVAVAGHEISPDPARPGRRRVGARPEI